LPHFSKFQCRQEAKEITACQNWPPGEITAFRIKFPVTWQVETISDQVIQQNLTSAFTPETAWEQLHHEVLRLFEKQRSITLALSSRIWLSLRKECTKKLK
jgi:hypothetical protein